MLLSVSVDELDINSVEQGQTAQVTFDAIEDKTFEGTVTKVGNTASASGGVAKYTVEITIPKDEEMKAGMNASATITIEEKENIVTIPVNACLLYTSVISLHARISSMGTSVCLECGARNISSKPLTRGILRFRTLCQKRPNIFWSSFFF